LIQPPYAYAIAEPAPETTARDPSQSVIGSTPTLVVERFLDVIRAGDIDGAMDLLGLDVEYTNVGLPTLCGRERIRRLFRATLGRAGAGFGRMSIQLWVCGRFDVSDGQIVL
jgi:limonene-1,2-epoxide hydrolase